MNLPINRTTMRNMHDALHLCHFPWTSDSGEQGKYPYCSLAPANYCQLLPALAHFISGSNPWYLNQDDWHRTWAKFFDVSHLQIVPKSSSKDSGVGNRKSMKISSITRENCSRISSLPYTYIFCRPKIFINTWFVPTIIDGDCHSIVERSGLSIEENESPWICGCGLSSSTVPGVIEISH